MNTKQKVFTDKVYKLTKEASPLSFMLPTRHTTQFPLLHFDEEQGSNRALRYARNQKSPLLQEFLHFHPLNGVGFEEINEERDANAEVERLNAEVDALIAARGMKVDQIEMVSRVLFNRDVTKVSTSELRRDILVYAKNYPADFLDVINDPALKLQANVSLFFEKGLLAFRKNNKEVWFNTTSNKTKMLNIPYGEEPMMIVSSFLQSDDGIENYKLLEKFL
ncbi:MAG: hypothetical protein ACKVJK_06290 [Methylophagaceae bacterium]